MNKKIFISYSEEDSFMANELVHRLKETSPGIIISQHDSHLGLNDNWDHIIKNQIRSASVFIVLVSKDLFRSSWALQELGAAIATGVTIIPVLIDNAETPFNINKYQYIDLRKGDINQTTQELQEALA